MKKIIVIGSPGAGKTTLSVKLSSVLNLPLIHLDVLSWRDDWKAVPKDEFDRLLLAELEKDAWIIDGNYNRTIPLRLKYCDTVIYMDYGRLACLCGVIKRVISNYGKSRPDMGGNCPERFDLKFLKFIWDYKKNNRTKNYVLLEEQDNLNIIILKNRRQCRAFLKSLSESQSD